MATEAERQAIVDDEHLRLLPLLYWVSAGFWGFYSIFIVAYFALIGTAFIAIPGEDGPPPAFGWVFIAMAFFSLLLLIAFTTFKVLAGLWMKRRQHRVATMVVAAVTCLEIPYGTLTGVLTFLVLARPSVRALYEGPAHDAGAQPSPEELSGAAVIESSQDGPVT